MDPDSMDSILTLGDLRPERRLNTLLQTGTLTRVDPKIAIKNYLNLSESLLIIADRYRKKTMNEVALLHYIRYLELMKKMRKHPKYTNIPLGKRSAFDYKMKAVSKIVKELTATVLNEFENIYNKSSLGLQMQDFDGIQDQRPTISTVRTFVSGEDNGHVEDPSKSPSQQKLSILPPTIVRDSMRASTESFNFSIKSKTDTLCGMRRAIFPTKQVRDFESIHRQRRIVRSHRTLKIPSRITTEFSYLTFKNNMKNIETVGYLAGRELNEEELSVTHLILPEQFGFSDFFKVKDSHILIKYLEQNELLILGWIHSHPIEKPYLSSSDMHYQSVFQSVLPEAVAMVYSPKEMKSTIFNLTPDHGLGLILNCRKKGFHIHPSNPPITMVSQHAIIDLIGDLIVKDFRNTRVFFDDEDTKFHGDFFERTLHARTSELYKYRKSEVIFVHVS
ncbi:hypothetical protein WA026_000485 [Henosepilachna vigintioctopunctata]|uniref:MPN domain-containing protein n=1 Tax=Henosepilachna vigintioctopunctata TaxID=420089 RepID=A0AAW1UZF0_9CUCU